MAAASPIVSAMSGIPSSSPFEIAIKQFIAGVNDKDGSKNPFLAELKSKPQDQADSPDKRAQSQVSAASLQQFVEDSVAQKRSTRTIKVLSRVHVFIEALQNLMAVCEKNLQAAPFGVSIAL